MSNSKYKKSELLFSKEKTVRTLYKVWFFKRESFAKIQFFKKLNIGHFDFETAMATVNCDTKNSTAMDGEPRLRNRGRDTNSAYTSKYPYVLRIQLNVKCFTVLRVQLNIKIDQLVNLLQPKWTFFIKTKLVDFDDWDILMLRDETTFFCHQRNVHRLPGSGSDCSSRHCFFVIFLSLARALIQFEEWIETTTLDWTFVFFSNTILSICQIP